MDTSQLFKGLARGVLTQWRTTLQQLTCGKCSKVISLGDTIESSGGRVAHVDCARPRMLTPDERALILRYCSNHNVAQCLTCGQGSLHWRELAADPLDGGSNLCPRCRKDLTENVRAHVYGCVVLPTEVRQRADALREAAQHLIKQSQQQHDRADVLIRQAEAALQERRKALRNALAKAAS